jgi:hypothetical protein
MKNTYWNGNGRYQADYNRLVELMPLMGKCDTVAGELIRAASRLGHDFYNNGMGNNTSGAVNFLLHKGAIDDETHNTIYEYTRGLIYGGHYEGDRFQVAMEHMVDSVIEFIRARPELETAENTEDMFSYEEPFQNFCEECGDETDGRGLYGSLCGYCEDTMLAEEEEEEYEY